MNEWQPIETAPIEKDILVYGYCEGELSGRSKTPEISVAYSSNGKSFYVSQGDYYTTYVDATHWMPLPQPPDIA